VSSTEQRNRTVYTRIRPGRQYDTLVLRPAEVVVLARHADELAGRVLELGCGAGRVTFYLAQLAGELHAIDVSPAMLEACARTVPSAILHQLDLRDLSGFETDHFDAVVAPFNVLDVLDDGGRGAVLDELARLLQPGGLLVFSSHNRGVDGVSRPWDLPSGSILSIGKAVVKLPVRTRNHLRLRGHQEQASDHAVLNDSAHDFSLLHYYIDRDAQQRQLRAHGFELLECLDLGAAVVGPGERAAHAPELHYVARAAS
jgi:SAM-dependent methyltransferase